MKKASPKHIFMGKKKSSDLFSCSSNFQLPGWGRGEPHKLSPPVEGDACHESPGVQPNPPGFRPRSPPADPHCLAQWWDAVNQPSQPKSPQAHR